MYTFQKKTAEQKKFDFKMMQDAYELKREQRKSLEKLSEKDLLIDILLELKEIQRKTY